MCGKKLHLRLKFFYFNFKNKANNKEMIQLRPYTTDDYPAIIALFLLNTPAYFCPPEQQDLEAFLKNEIEHYFVAEEHGKVLASGGCAVEKNEGWLCWFIVDAREHGKGLGRLVINKCLEILNADVRVEKIKLWTSQLVYPFYEKFGFVVTETEDDFWGAGMHLYKMEITDMKKAIL